jgi:CBS domain-containing protein/rubredoxin
VALTVADIMDTDTPTARPQDGVEVAVQTLAEHDIGGLPVVNEGGRCVGILTEADLVIADDQGELRIPHYIELFGGLIPLEPMRALHLNDKVRRAAAATVEELMTPDPVTIGPDATTHEAAQLLAERRISGMPVVARDGSIAGMLSEFDLIAKSGTHVRDVMTREVVSVLDTAPLDHVRGVLVTQRLKRVPVIDGHGRLVGIISRADLVRELAYRWQCRRCSYLARARRPPEGCPRCGAANSFDEAPPPPAVATCPTCGRPLD